MLTSYNVMLTFICHLRYIIACMSRPNVMPTVSAHMVWFTSHHPHIIIHISSLYVIIHMSRTLIIIQCHNHMSLSNVTTICLYLISRIYVIIHMSLPYVIIHFHVHMSLSTCHVHMSLSTCHAHMSLSTCHVHMSLSNVT